MDRYEKITLTNFCMIPDGNGNVVVEMQDKYGPRGLVFPGGHVEPGEALTDAVIREVYEETGLTVSGVRLCGVKDYAEADGSRYMVFLYRAESYSGELRSSSEGEAFWTPLASLTEENTLWHLGKMLEIFRGGPHTELFCADGKEPVLK